VDTFLTIASKRDERRYAERSIPDDAARRILEAGRLTGSAVNRQPWTFVVVESPEIKERLAETVYAADNIRGAQLVVAIVVEGSPGFDSGRAAQNMMLAAWNEGITSCPNGMPDAEKAAAALGLSEEERPLNILSFGYPVTGRRADTRSAQTWLAGANRKPFDEVVRRI
jgi:nitroreductase